jgi:hypothetical protein
LAILLLLNSLAWMISLAARLEQVGIPEQARETSEALLPGNFPLPHPAVRAHGDWVSQHVGGRAFLATREAGSELVVPFYGTELAVVVRIGPDAGRVYVTVDGSPWPQLPSDDTGSYLVLHAPRAAIDEIRIATGLRPGLHVVTLINGGGAELAISSIEVTNRPSLGWVLALIAAALTGLLFLAIRQSWFALARASGWLRPVAQAWTVPDDGVA